MSTTSDALEKFIGDAELIAELSDGKVYLDQCANELIVVFQSVRRRPGSPQFVRAGQASAMTYLIGSNDTRGRFAGKDLVISAVLHVAGGSYEDVRDGVTIHTTLMTSGCDRWVLQDVQRFCPMTLGVSIVDKDLYDKWADEREAELAGTK